MTQLEIWKVVIGTYQKTFKKLHTCYTISNAQKLKNNSIRDTVGGITIVITLHIK